LSKQLDKEVDLVMIGENTELDKTVMEKIGDPLVHLVRNSLDHGLENAKDRTDNGKSSAGTITLNAYHHGGSIVIEVQDDGAGLNKERIRDKAIEKGLISEDEQLSDSQVYDLIFQPGFSTADVVSDVSGRGVGMDVVRRNIAELNGSIDVSSTPGKGSIFSIRLPLTLAILDGQLVKVGDEVYIFPLVSIVESIQLEKSMLNNITGNQFVMQLRNDYVPIICLQDVFNIGTEKKDLEGAMLVVVEGDDEKIGIVVDELLGQQQVVIKSLEQNYQKVDSISGATILGDGTVALIVDISGLNNSSSDKKSDEQTQAA
jgi:two-component system chemotaxis sensor kinase CheA